MDHIERYFECNAPGVIFERFEDEPVVINLDSGITTRFDTPARSSGSASTAAWPWARSSTI